MTLVRFRTLDDAEPELELPPEDLDPSVLPEIVNPPPMPELPANGVHQDVVYSSEAGEEVFTFVMDDADLPRRMDAIAYQVYAIDGTRGLDELARAMDKLGRPRRVSGGPRPELVTTPEEIERMGRGGVLLRELHRSRTAIAEIAERTCKWAEDVSRGFAIRHLIYNRLQTKRERDRYFRQTRDSEPMDLARRDLSGPAILALAQAWRPIVTAMAALDDTKDDLSGLITDAMLSSQPDTEQPSVLVNALARAFMAPGRDDRVAFATEQKDQKEQAVHEAVAYAGQELPLLFRIWSEGELARRAVAALDGARTDSDRIVALRKIPKLKQTIVDALESARMAADDAIEQFFDADNDLAWKFPPLLEKVRIAAGIRQGTLEWRAIDERLEKASHHWISKASAAASLVGRVPSPIVFYANAAALALGAVDVAQTLIDVHRGNAVVDAALDPSDSLAADGSMMGMFGILVVQLFVFKLLGKLGGYILALALDIKAVLD